MCRQLIIYTETYKWLPFHAPFCCCCCLVFYFMNIELYSISQCFCDCCRHRLLLFWFHFLTINRIRSRIIGKYATLCFFHYFTVIDQYAHMHRPDLIFDTFPLIQEFAFAMLQTMKMLPMIKSKKWKCIEVVRLASQSVTNVIKYTPKNRWRRE